MKKLVKIIAFWNNQGHEGLCCSLTEEDLKDKSSLVKFLDGMLSFMDQLALKIGWSPTQLSQHWLNLLRSIVEANPTFLHNGEVYRKLSREDNIKAMSIIYWLEQRGFLISDDFNGLTYVYEEEGPITVREPKRQPTIIPGKNE